MDADLVSARLPPEPTNEELKDEETQDLDDDTDSAVSETETVCYGHECFENYRDRVLSLCALVWPKTPSESFEIERMNGGGYNRVIGINITANHPDPPRRFILRIPRWEDECNVGREITMVQLASRDTSLPVPTILTYDLSCNNPLKSLYTIQVRISGQILSTLYDNLNHQQRVTVATEWAKLLLRMHKKDYSAAGQLWPHEKSDSPDPSATIMEFEVPPRGRERRDRVLPPQQTEEDDTTVFWLCTQFRRWKLQSYENDFDDILWPQLARIGKEMDDRGMFDDDEYKLEHGDLHPRNVLASVLDDHTVKIEGVIDWDGAHFVPQWATCDPPDWLWAWDHPDEPTCPEQWLEPIGAENEEIKAAFDQTVGDLWRKYAYKQQYAVARKLSSFAVRGGQNNESINEYVKFTEDWDEMKDSLNMTTSLPHDQEPEARKLAEEESGCAPETEPCNKSNPESISEHQEALEPPHSEPVVTNTLQTKHVEDKQKDHRQSCLFIPKWAWLPFSWVSRRVFQ